MLVQPLRSSKCQLLLLDYDGTLIPYRNIIHHHTYLCLLACSALLAAAAAAG
jgi:hypothetical protein